GEFWQIPPSREAGVNLFRRDLQGGTTVLITQNRSLSGGGSWNSGLATQRGEFNLTPLRRLPSHPNKDIWQLIGVRFSPQPLATDHQGKEIGRPLPTGLLAHVQPVASPKHHASEGVPDRVIVDLRLGHFQISRHRWPLILRVGQRLA